MNDISWESFAPSALSTGITFYTVARSIFSLRVSLLTSSFALLKKIMPKFYPNGPLVNADFIRQKYLSTERASPGP
jgi:hypothetical protein